ncbi:MAG: ABC transporter substrate-binding protein [Acetobacteraceae bacterium]
MLAVCGSVALMAVAAQAQPGVTKDTIRIGMYGPLTGAVSMYGYPINDGAIAVYKQINAEGGIYGRKIVIVPEDGACNPVKTRAAVEKLLEEDNVFIVHGGSCSAAAYAARPEFIRSQVPDVLMAATDDRISTPASPYIFTTTLTGSQDGASMLRFAESDHAVKRLAVVQHNDDWAQSRIAAIRAGLKGSSIKLVADEILNRGASDATAQVLKIKQSHPDMIFMITYPAESAVFLRDARKYGVEGPFVGTVGIQDMLDLAQRAGGLDAVKNTYADAFLKGPIGSPEMKQYTDLVTKYFPNIKLQSLNFYGMSGAYAIIAALKAAGPDLTRAKFIAALDHLKDADAGPAYCTITFTPSDHQGCHDAHMWTVRDGKIAVVGPVWKDGN